MTVLAQESGREVLSLDALFDIKPGSQADAMRHGEIDDDQGGLGKISGGEHASERGLGIARSGARQRVRATAHCQRQSTPSCHFCFRKGKKSNAAFLPRTIGVFSVDFL